MLICLGFGTVPSKRTVPFKFAAPVAVGGGPPARTPGVEKEIAKQTARVTPKIEIEFFACIQIHLT
jgi:hypothetical protein